MSAREKPFSSEEYARAAVELASIEADEALSAGLEKKVRGDALAFLASQSSARSAGARAKGGSTTVSTTLSVAENVPTASRTAWWWGFAAAAAVLLWWWNPRPSPSSTREFAREQAVAPRAYVVPALGVHLVQTGAGFEVSGEGICSAPSPCELGVEANGHWSTLLTIPSAAGTRLVAPLGETVRGRLTADPSKTFPLELDAR